LVTILAQWHKKKTKFDDLLVSIKRQNISLSYSVAFLFTSSLILDRFEYWGGVGNSFVIYIVLLVLWIIRIHFNALRDYLKLKLATAINP
jgi:Ca2+/Na+ antiporter